MSVSVSLRHGAQGETVRSLQDVDRATIGGEIEPVNQYMKTSVSFLYPSLVSIPSEDLQPGDDSFSSLRTAQVHISTSDVLLRFGSFRSLNIRVENRMFVIRFADVKSHKPAVLKQ